MDVNRILSLLDINLENLKGKIYGSIRIKEEIFKNPLFEISISGKDLKYQGFDITKAYLLLMGKDLSNLIIRNISLNIGKNYFKGSGTLNLFKMNGEIKGNIYVSPLNNLFSFYWKGDLNEGKGEIISRNIRQKGKITFNGKGDISGNLIMPLLKGILNLDIIGKNWKWRIYGKGVNLEKYLNLLEFKINDDLSFNGNLLLNLYDNLINLGISGIFRDGKIIGDLVTGDIKGRIIYDFKNLIEISDIYYSELKLGDIILNISSQGLDIGGDILGGKLSGRVNFNKGIISLYGINLKSISEDLRGRISGEIIIEDFPKFKFVSDEIFFRDFKLKDINLNGELRDGLYLNSISLFLFDKFELKGDTYIQKKDGKFDIKGKIFENEFFGTYEKEFLNLYGDKFILKEFKIILNNWKIDLDNKNEKFSFSSPYLEYQGILIKNLNVNGKYKDILDLSLKGELYGILWEINGILKDEFNFELYLDPSKDFKLLSHYSYLFKSKWLGSLNFKDNIHINLTLLKTEIPRIISGKIVGNFNEKAWNLDGDFNFMNKGNLKFSLDSYKNGKIEGRSLPLEILKDLNIMNIFGDLTLNFNLKEYALENGDLYVNFDFPLIKKKIESNLKIVKKEDYEIKGDIINLSKNKGIIDGVFRTGKYNINIILPDSEFLNSIIPKEFTIKNLEKGKIILNLSGNLKEVNGEGSIIFSSPINIPYILNKVYSINLKLKYFDNNAYIESLFIETESSKITGSGEIFPKLNLNLNLSRIALDLSYFLRGYSDWNISIKNIKEPSIEGKVLIYNSLISYPQDKIEELKELPNIKLSLDVNLGENINFSLPNLLNLSLKGGVKVLGTLSKPLLIGKIDFSKGNIQILNRIFSIDYGYIKFPGLSFEENIWELSGSSIIQNYLVSLKAYGFMGQSSIYLTSVPPLSQKEILFLLLGQERLSLAKEETLPFYSLLEEIPIGIQSFLSGILAEYLLNPLLSEISRILGLESIKVQYTLESFIPTWDKIIFEKRLGEDIIMRTNYSLGKGEFSTLELEYLLRSGLTLKWLTSIEGENLFSFEYKTKF